MDTSGFLVFWQPLKPCGPIVRSHMIISYLACWLGALEDLNMAITLSNGTGSVACQAYTQRGLIYRLEGIYMLPYDICNGIYNSFDFFLHIYWFALGEDEKSLEDFKHASRLGGQFAKQQVVAMNPYTAMCNQMLCEVMQKVRNGEI